MFEGIIQISVKSYTRRLLPLSFVYVNMSLASGAG